MQYSYGSSPAEQGGVRDIFVRGAIIGGALAALGGASFLALTTVDQLVDVDDSYRAASAGVGVLGGFIFGTSVLLMRIFPPPNLY